MRADAVLRFAGNAAPQSVAFIEEEICTYPVGAFESATGDGGRWPAIVFREAVIASLLRKQAKGKARSGEPSAYP